ncbi:hypothetical protein ACFE04_010795 [Oxalis oulophora]
MAAKRFLNESSSSDDQDDQNERRTRTRPSFANIVGEVTAMNSFRNLFSTIEPLLRRVVNEEVNRVFTNNVRFNRPPLLIQQMQPSGLKLIFAKTISLPIFTGTKITTVDNSQLQILLVDTRGGEQVHTSFPHPIKAEVVVLDGDFLAGHDNNIHWTSEEFESNIVKERTGKRPLLAGELSVTVRDGYGLIGDVEFTDNSSWIRSRKFRIGVRVVPGSYHGVRICEGITEAFIVKDHRGELYKKHHPPRLEDEVWRLEKIGKDGVFHKKLASDGIHTVQDFLKLSTVETSKLRVILGPGMSDKMWEAEINHRVYQGHDLNILSRSYIDSLVREAYANWSSLEVVEGFSIETALLTQGEEEVDQYPNEQTMGYLPSTSHMGSDDWNID